MHEYLQNKIITAKTRLQNDAIGEEKMSSD